MDESRELASERQVESDETKSDLSAFPAGTYEVRLEDLRQLLIGREPLPDAVQYNLPSITAALIQVLSDINPDFPRECKFPIIPIPRIQADLRPARPIIVTGKNKGIPN